MPSDPLALRRTGSAGVGSWSAPGTSWIRLAGRSARRRLRRGVEYGLRARTGLDTSEHPPGVTPNVIDHGFLVPDATAPTLDHRSHQDRLVALVTNAVRAAGGSVSEPETRRREWTRVSAAGDRDRIWDELTRASSSVETGTLPLTVHPLHAERRQRPARRLAEVLLGPEFADAVLPPRGVGPPARLAGSAPAGDRWLIAGHETDAAGSRHLGIESAIELSLAMGGTSPRATAVDFPIDAVYTWVDCSDAHWREAYEQAERAPGLVRAATSASRFDHLDELRFSLRSVAEFAPWIRHIWLVTADQVPAWLDPDDPRITVVSHSALWGSEPGLPTFNSQAIEANLHRIPGLSEHFLYFNDDMLIGRPIAPDTFFTADGRPKVFVSSARIPAGEPRPGDLAPDAAGKNNRRLVADLTGRSMSTKFEHAPYALSRSIIGELEQHFGAELAATRRARFRSMSDVTAAGGLHHSYALATGRAVMGEIRNRYVDLESPDADHRLDMLARFRWYESFCVNVVLDGPRNPAGLLRFLHRYFPNPAEWEIDATQV